MHRAQQHEHRETQNEQSMSFEVRIFFISHKNLCLTEPRAIASGIKIFRQCRKTVETDLSDSLRAS